MKISMETNSSKAYGCLFCRSGAEKTIAEDINRRFEGITAVVPEKARYRRVGGTAYKEMTVLIPGYIFFQADEDFPVMRLLGRDTVYRVLSYEDYDWHLRGTDRLFAEKMFEYHGYIDFSKAYYEGDRIRIIDGFLGGQEAQITRVNRRAQTAQLRLQVQDKELSIWLGFELIEKDKAPAQAE